MAGGRAGGRDEFQALRMYICVECDDDDERRDDGRSRDLRRRCGRGNAGVREKEKRRIAGAGEEKVRRLLAGGRRIP